MRRYSILFVVSSVALIACGYVLTSRGKGKFKLARMRRKMMERMMKAMPEDFPPKVISSVMPRLQEQNEEILALLKEQNELLRQKKQSESE